MEPWGVHSFENEDAKEWCQAYREMGLPVAGSTLDVALGDSQQANLSASIACRAVAAIEAVAYALGRGSPEAMDAFRGAPQADPKNAAALIEKGNEAISAITGGSGLSAYWKETRPGNHDAWIASMNALQARLNGGEEVAEEAPEEVSEPRARARAPEPQPVSTDVSLQNQLDDIRNAISGLESDIEVMRQEIREGMIEIAKRIARGAS